MGLRTAGMLTLVGFALAASQASASSYAQLSSTQTQMADTTPKMVTLNQTDAAKGIENNNGAITIKEGGMYFVIAAGQIGGQGQGSVRLWMRQNGKDVDNSNTEQTVANGSTCVLVCQGVGEFKSGDKLHLVFSATGPQLGLVASTPANEPGIPSMIFSAFKVNPSHYAQLSSTQTQMAKASPSVITLNQTDAAKGIENSDGTITLKEAGVYFAMAAGQVGGKGKGSVKLWMRQNGKDVDNSNTEQSCANGSTCVLVCQGVGECKAGDKLQLVQAAHGSGLGMVASTPAGEAGIPSMIFSAFKVPGTHYCQLSSLKTQPASGHKTISLEQADAAQGIHHAGDTVTIKESGTYFVVAAGQVGGKGKGSVRLWLRQNGKDVDNSNAEQSCENGSTAVLVSQGVMELKAGETLQLAQSATAPGLGMVASTPRGEAAIPSMILSIVRVE